RDRFPGRAYLVCAARCRCPRAPGARVRRGDRSLRRGTPRQSAALDAHAACLRVARSRAAVRRRARRRDLRDRARRGHARRAAAETDARARAIHADYATIASARAAARALSPACHRVRVAASTRSPLRRRCRMTTDVISADLKTVLRRLKLGRMLDTLPE